MNDNTRKQDLDELVEFWSTAPNAFWRDQYEKQMNKIIKESRIPAIVKYREELLMAVRNKDRRHVNYVQNEINHIMQNLTNGREIS